jgi:hypothetical protein
MYRRATTTIKKRTTKKNNFLPTELKVSFIAVMVLHYDKREKGEGDHEQGTGDNRVWGCGASGVSSSIHTLVVVLFGKKFKSTHNGLLAARVTFFGVFRASQGVTVA